ncbi:MAG: MBL fold metallo-hydrolase [Acidobacteriota bacterium]
MRIVVLGSGSSGNCTFIESGRTRLLVDLGFGPRSLARRFREAGLSGARIDAILITHGHTDHVKGIAPFVQRQPAVVYATLGTREEVADLAVLDRIETFHAGETFDIGDLTIETFPIPHDAAEPVGFSIRSNGVRGLIATDVGHLSAALVERTRGCDWLILESNHDVELLKVGPYPWELKRRVLGPWGHLSNTELADFLLEDFDGQARHLWLAHLSRKNNLPALALSTAQEALRRRERLGRGCSTQVHLTHQTVPSIVVDL